MESPQKRPSLAKGSLPPKFVLKSQPLKDNDKKSRYDKGLELLKKKQTDLIEARKRQKIKATAELNANPEDHKLQDNLARALKGSHISVSDFQKTLNKDFRIIDNVIHYMMLPIAELFEGDDPNAYEEVAKAKGEGYSPVYKRFTLDGYSNKDYVSINGAMIRRQAHRGITPLEIKQFRDKETLLPAFNNKEDLFRESPGIHFDDDGFGYERKDFNKSDVQFLKSLGSVETSQFPADHAGLLAFTQIRNGASKVLSATSTPKAITSNHGHGFGKFGTVTIDLAQVPTSSILHHYNVEAFETGRVKEMIRQINERSIGQSFTHEELTKKKVSEIKKQAESTINEAEIESHVTRGNLSFMRNREILFTSIPFESITNYIPSQSKVAYENAYKAKFKERLAIARTWRQYTMIKDDQLSGVDAVIDRHLQENISVYKSDVHRNDVEPNVISYLENIKEQFRAQRTGQFAKGPGHYPGRNRY